MNKFYELIKSIKLLRNYCLLTPPSQPPLSSSTSLPSSPQSKKDGTQYFVPRLNLIRTFFVWNKSSNCKMTVGRRDILFADPRETERLIGRVLAGMNIWRKNSNNIHPNHNQLRCQALEYRLLYFCHLKFGQFRI